MSHTAWPKCSVNSIFSKVLVLGGVVLIAGCVKPTKFPRYLTVADVVNNVKCQLYQAIQDNADGYSDSGFKGSQFSKSNRWIYGWTAKFEIFLEVLREGSIAGDSSLRVPYTVGTFTIGASAMLKRNSKARLTFDFNAENNLAIFMNTDQCAYTPEHRRRRNLAGETGLNLWFGKLIQGMVRAGIKPNGFTYSVNFVVSSNGSILPSYTYTHPTLEFLSGKVTGSKKREDMNNLKVTFAPYKPDPVTEEFADSDLGMALQRIEDALNSEIDRREQAGRDKTEATDKVTELTTSLKIIDSRIVTLKGGNFLATEKNKQDIFKQTKKLETQKADANTDLGLAKSKVVDSGKAVEDANAQIKKLSEIKRLLTVRRQRVRTTRRRGISQSTENQLNQQLLRESIRDITR